MDGTGHTLGIGLIVTICGTWTSTNEKEKPFYMADGTGQAWTSGATTQRTPQCGLMKKLRYRFEVKGSSTNDSTTHPRIRSWTTFAVFPCIWPPRTGVTLQPPWQGQGSRQCIWRKAGKIVLWRSLPLSLYLLLLYNKLLAAGIVQANSKMKCFPRRPRKINVQHRQTRTLRSIY